MRTSCLEEIHEAQIEAHLVTAEDANPGRVAVATPFLAEEKFSKELIHAIGLFIMAAASSEHALAIHMARLIAHPGKVDPITVLAVAGTETSVRLQQIQVLARFRLKSEAASEVIGLCDKIRESFQRRNDIAHSAHAAGSKLDEVILKNVKLKANGTLVADKPFTTKQIQEFTQTLVTRLRELGQLLTDAGVTPLDFLE
jgi:hypothetical protein